MCRVNLCSKGSDGPSATLCCRSRRQRPSPALATPPSPRGVLRKSRVMQPAAPVTGGGGGRGPPRSRRCTKHTWENTPSATPPPAAPPDTPPRQGLLAGQGHLASAGGEALARDRGTSDGGKELCGWGSLAREGRAWEGSASSRRWGQQRAMSAWRRQHCAWRMWPDVLCCRFPKCA